MGRKKGSKDTKPRVRRTKTQIEAAKNVVPVTSSVEVESPEVGQA